MRATLAIPLVVFAMFTSPPVNAAGGPGARRASPAPVRVEPEAVSAMESKLARFYFGRGTSAYERGDYRGALGDFDVARRFMPVGAFDYNIGRCLDRLEALEEAIATYSRYLAAPGVHRESAAVRRRIAVLRQRLARRGRGA